MPHRLLFAGTRILHVSATFALAILPLARSSFKLQLPYRNVSAAISKTSHLSPYRLSRSPEHSQYGFFHLPVISA